MAANRTVGQRTLEVLCGGIVPEEVPEVLELIGRTVDDPTSLTFNLERIVEDPDIRSFRYHLVRVQVESELRMRDDVDRHSKRLWVARTLERVAFGGLLMDGSEDEEEED